jgi:hypothetical protein
MPNNVIMISGKKYMWDGIDYPSGEKASERMQKYKGDGFEVEVFEEDRERHLYTRRVVKEVIVQNA